MNELSLDAAQRIIADALVASRDAGYKPMAVAVVDKAGHLKAFAREDGASMFRSDIALAKAWGVVGMGVSSRQLAQRAADNPNFFVSLAATSQGRFLAQTGAVPIRTPEGELLGAVGASGGTGDEDEQVCIAGVRAAGLRFD
ncbi:heme-binding protein [Azoarcus sp. L1K30]|uniref:GlcG/HbpS family heme-binding protein n=1 Tax=Azoarcus sp. L1K30 TaxID=2820277 RepID=UPI001B844266|nr:heme-binding protein [Azoarcus sp. L1K30]MBR0567888.1 heme-binding protein [Azoarcus sp. L1K30]